MSNPLAHAGNPLVTTWPIYQAWEQAKIPEKREAFTVPLWENIITKHMILANHDYLTLNGQQYVDSSLQKVDLMVRYSAEKIQATALFLVECKRNKQGQYDIRILEDQLDRYANCLFQLDGIERHKPFIYGAVAYGQHIRMYRIPVLHNLRSGAIPEAEPIWGGEKYDMESYKDIGVTEHAHQILAVFQDIISVASDAVRETSTED